jgi:hypothetical protein
LNDGYDFDPSTSAGYYVLGEVSEKPKN